MYYIKIQAESAHENGDGTVTLEIPSTTLTLEQDKILAGLFPDLESAVTELLMKQALLSSLLKRQ